MMVPPHCELVTSHTKYWGPGPSVRPASPPAASVSRTTSSAATHATTHRVCSPCAQRRTSADEPHPICGRSSARTRIGWLIGNRRARIRPLPPCRRALVHLTTVPPWRINDPRATNCYRYRLPTVKPRAPHCELKSAGPSVLGERPCRPRPGARPGYRAGFAPTGVAARGQVPGHRNLPVDRQVPRRLRGTAGCVGGRRRPRLRIQA